MAYMRDANYVESILCFQLTKKAKGKMLIFRKVEKREIVPGLKGTVSQTAHVQIINQKWSAVFKFEICETKWRQQAEDNPHSHGGRRNNSGRKKFF